MGFEASRPHSTRHWSPGWTTDTLAHKSSSICWSFGKGEHSVSTFWLGAASEWHCDWWLRAKNLLEVGSNLSNLKNGNQGNKSVTITQLPRLDTRNNRMCNLFIFILCLEIVSGGQVCYQLWYFQQGRLKLGLCWISTLWINSLACPWCQRTVPMFSNALNALLNPVSATYYGDAIVLFADNHTCTCVIMCLNLFEANYQLIQWAPSVHYLLQHVSRWSVLCTAIWWFRQDRTSCTWNDQRQPVKATCHTSQPRSHSSKQSDWSRISKLIYIDNKLITTHRFWLDHFGWRILARQQNVRYDRSTAHSLPNLWVTAPQGAIGLQPSPCALSGAKWTCEGDL